MAEEMTKEEKARIKEERRKAFLAGVLTEEILKKTKIIDLSADFRIKDVSVYEKWYKIEHKSPQFIGEAVYGLCEVNRDKVKIANWNVQTFFDANNDGTEYSEFAKSKTWGEEMYKERLKRLCSVIKKLDADIFIMEELENSNVLFDISNFLAGEWNPRKIYRYACFSKNEGGAIGCAFA